MIRQILCYACFCTIGLGYLWAMDPLSQQKEWCQKKQKALTALANGNGYALQEVDELIKHFGKGLAMEFLIIALQNKSKYTKLYLNVLFQKGAYASEPVMIDDKRTSLIDIAAAHGNDHAVSKLLEQPGIVTKKSTLFASNKPLSAYKAIKTILDKRNKGTYFAPHVTANINELENMKDLLKKHKKNGRFKTYLFR